MIQPSTLVSIENSSPESKPIICVVVGDPGIGKSTLIKNYLRDSCISDGDYVPTTREMYTVNRTVRASGIEKKVKLHIIDTGGQDNLDRLRPLDYPTADVFILCFSVIQPSSFSHILTKWVPELNRHKNGAVLFLVGTQVDCRSNMGVLLKLTNSGQSPVSEAKAIRIMKKIGANEYIQISNSNAVGYARRNLKNLFNFVMLAALEKRSLTGLPAPSTARIPRVLQKENNPTTDAGTLRVKRQNFKWKAQIQKCTKLKRIMFLSCIFH